MKPQFQPYHHFKGNSLSPSEKVERKVVQLLFQSKISDAKRETSVIFELKHSSECIQVGRILAQKRRLRLDLADVACALHDISVIISGTYQDHAKRGAPIAEKILKDVGGFSPAEMKIICDAVAHHSEKNIYSKNPYQELVKDADVFDCSFYKDSEVSYRSSKSEKLFKHYVKRIKKVRRELGLPDKPIFRT